MKNLLALAVLALSTAVQAQVIGSVDIPKLVLTLDKAFNTEK